MESSPFFYFLLYSPFQHPWDQRLTLMAFSKDFAYLISPILVNRILPSSQVWWTQLFVNNKIWRNYFTLWFIKVILSLILCVHLTGSPGTQILGQTLFWMCLWGCLWVRLIFESVDLVKHSTLLNMTGPHPVIWTHGQKKRLSKRESPLPDWWSWNIGLFPPLDSDWNMGSSWVSRC